MTTKTCCFSPISKWSPTRDLMHAAVVAAALGLCSHSGYAQAPDFTWAKRAGRADSESGLGITTDDLRYFRDTATFDGTTLTSAGLEDIFIANLADWAVPVVGPMEVECKGLPERCVFVSTSGGGVCSNEEAPFAEVNSSVSDVSLHR